MDSASPPIPALTFPLQLPVSHETSSVSQKRKSTLRSKSESCASKSYDPVQISFEQSSITAHDLLPNQITLPEPTSNHTVEILDCPGKHGHDIQIPTIRKRARLTKKNLKIFDAMGKVSAVINSQASSSSITTIDKDFGPKLTINNIIHTGLDAQPSDDSAVIKALLNRQRNSPPPDQVKYRQYLMVTEDKENELGVELSAYPLLMKRTAEREVSGYLQRPNHPWSEVDNHLIKGLSDARPDLVESYRKRGYPLNAVEALAGELVPTTYNEAMSAYAVEFQSAGGDFQEATLQCAYDGALMTEGSRITHQYMGKTDEEMFGKTQALTMAYNGNLLTLYGHHVVQPSSFIPTAEDDGTSLLQYHQNVLASDHPRDSFDGFQSAYKHVRNAQDLGHQWATERKDALWEHERKGN